MKKIVYLLICLTLVFTQLSCFADELEDYSVVSETIYFNTSCSKPIEIEEPVQVENKISISLFNDITLTFEAALDYVLAVMYECSEDFYNYVEFSDGSVDKYMCFDVANYKITPSDVEKIIMLLNYEYGDILASNYYFCIKENVSGTIYAKTIGFKYIYEDLSVVKEKRVQIKEKADIIINKINSARALTDLEKVLLVHDHIAKNAYYQPNQELIEDFYYHTLDSALLEGVTVCQGYALAMNYILNQIGIECISCRCDAVNHVWNCVKIDGVWYHIDLTWNDRRILLNTQTFDFITYNEFVTSSDTQLISKFNYHYKDILSLDGSDEITQEHQEYINNIKQFYSDAQADKYSYEEVMSILSAILDFEYITLKTNNVNSNNSDFEENYIFNTIDYVSFKVLVNETDYIYHLLRSNGFDYIDGKFKIIINTTSGTPFPETAVFEFDDLKAMDISVSNPIIDGDYCKFLNIINAEVSEAYYNKTFLMKNKGKDNKFDINDVNLKRYNNLLAYQTTVMLDTTQVNLVKNSIETEFFFWDNNLKPYAYKLIYNNQ